MADTVDLQQGQPVESYTTGIEGGEGGQVDDRTKGQVEDYVSILMHLIHGEETRATVMEILTGDPKSPSDPFMGVPQAAVSVNDMGVNLMKQSGAGVSFTVQLGASVFLINDLIELGYAAGLWEKQDEQETAALFEDSMQIVIERGLADGSIDPIQLQLDTESLMSEDQRRAGDSLAAASGMESKPSQQAMTQQYADEQVRKVKQSASKASSKIGRAHV